MPNKIIKRTNPIIKIAKLIVETIIPLLIENKILSFHIKHCLKIKFYLIIKRSINKIKDFTF